MSRLWFLAVLRGVGRRSWSDLPAAPSLAVGQEKKDEKKDDKEKMVHPVALLGFDENGCEGSGCEGGDLLVREAGGQAGLLPRGSDRPEEGPRRAATEPHRRGQARRGGQGRSTHRRQDPRHRLGGPGGEEAVPGRQGDRHRDEPRGRRLGRGSRCPTTWGRWSGKLADAVDESVTKNAEKLVPKPVAVADRIAEFGKKLGKGGASGRCSCRWRERHIGQPAVDPAAQTEVMRFAKETGFEIVDPDEGGKSKADVLVTGEGFSEVAGRVGGLVSVRARVELKAVDRPASGGV